MKQIIKLPFYCIGNGRYFWKQNDAQYEKILIVLMQEK